MEAETLLDLFLKAERILSANADKSGYVATLWLRIFRILRGEG